MTTAAISLSKEGAVAAACLRGRLAGVEIHVHEGAAWEGEGHRFQTLAAVTAELFARCRGLIYFAPCGAVVRSILPHVRHKTTDPAVVVVDVGARYAVSLLSGHEGGANRLAIEVANILDAEPVVTTTTEAVKDLIVGVGCRRDTPSARIVSAIRAALAGAKVSVDRVRLLASADIKASEPGLQAAADELGILVRFISSRAIREARRSFARSEVAERRLSLPAVAEPAALLAGRRTQFLLTKRIIEGVTVAIAQESLPWSESAPEEPSIAPTAPNEPSARVPSS